MISITESKKDVDTVVADLGDAIARHGYNILHTYDIKKKLESKGQSLPNECRIIEVCNPSQAAKVLNVNMAVSLALPCRISVYEENGRTWIGTIKPSALLAIFPGAGKLAMVADEVEKALLGIIDEVK